MANLKDIQDKIEKLIQIINKSRKEYWLENNPSLSDEEYDKYFNQLKELEEKHPQFKSIDSPTIKVGYFPVSSQLQKKKHIYPMLSLSNAYSKENILSFCNSVSKQLKDGFQEYFLELKLDGLSVSLVYENYILKSAITRGNGLIGEDITHNIWTIDSLPKKIKYKNLIVSGEIILSNSQFKKINDDIIALNKRLIKENKNPLSTYLSPRNLTAGTIKHKSLELVKARKLDIFLYNVANYSDFNLTTQKEMIKFLKDNNFPTFRFSSLATSIEDIYKYFAQWDKDHKNLDYMVDGVVIKLNSLQDREILGNTINYPKWAIAYKFKTNSAISELLDVEYGIGRSGKITFVAKLKPVYLDNSYISRVHLYNYKFIQEHQIKLHDNLEIIKSASVIPKIINVIHTDKSKNIIQEPSICPFCSSKLVKYENLIDFYCINIDCPGILVDSLIHFCSQEGMNIVGLGPKIIQKLFDLKLLNSIIDIYNLKNIDKELFLNNKNLNFKEKRYQNLIYEIENSKKQPLINLLFALGIKFLGKGTIKLLLEYFPSIDDLIDLTVEDLTKIKNIGKTTASSICLFFKNPKNLELINFFKENNFILSVDKNQDLFSKSIFYQKSILLTGSFPSCGKAAIHRYLQSKEANIAYNISSKIDYLIVGENPGQKLALAQKNPKIKILSYQEFLNLKNDKK